MASEIRVNSIKNRSGLGTITVSDSGAVFSGVTTFAQIQTTSGEITVGTGASVFSPATNVLALGTNNAERVRISSTGSVGIGTDNPVSLLHLSDTSGALVINREIDAVNQINFRTINTQRGSIGANSGACFTVYDSVSSEKLRVSAAGNVGIGTDNPDGQLTIRKQILATDTITNSVSHLSLISNLGGSNAHQSVIHFGPRNASTNLSPAAISAIASGNTASDLAFYVNANSNYSSTPNTEALRISNTGNVGIGTDNPQRKLSIKDSGNTFISIENSTNVTSGLIGANSSGLTIISRDTQGGSTEKPIQFITGSTEKVRIDSSGNIGIGTDYAPTKLTVAGDIIIRPTDGNVNSGNLALKFGLSNNPDNNQQKTSIIAKPNGSWGRHDLHFCLDTGGDLGNADISDSKVVFMNDGKVGIGTTQPSAKFEVGSGDLLVDGSIRTKNYVQNGTTSEGTHLLKEIIANSSFEANPFSHPFLMNDLANHIARGGSYAISGLTSVNSGIANLFSTQSFWTASNSQFSGSTFTITLTNLQHGLSYGAYAGIVFGSSNFAPASLKIETSTDNGSNWTTRLDHTGRQSTYFTAFSSGGTATNAIRYTIGQGAAGSVRIQSLWAFNYASTGMHHYFLPRDGGQLYGNLSFPSGNGIDFSATANGGTSSSELFNDYEEGTFTPTVSPTSGSFSTAVYSDRLGYYRKVGSVVYIQIRTNFNSFNVGSASGQPIVTGLPFTPDLNFANAYLNVGQCNNWTNAPSGALVDVTNARIVLLENSNNPGFNNDFSEISDMGSTSENRIQISGWYVASS